jgi:hypothetical protein
MPRQSASSLDFQAAAQREQAKVQEAAKAAAAKAFETIKQERRRSTSLSGKKRPAEERKPSPKDSKRSKTARPVVHEPETEDDDEEITPDDSEPEERSEDEVSDEVEEEQRAEEEEAEEEEEEDTRPQYSRRAHASYYTQPPEEEEDDDGDYNRSFTSGTTAPYEHSASKGRPSVSTSSRSRYENDDDEIQFNPRPVSYKYSRPAPIEPMTSPKYSRSPVATLPPFGATRKVNRDTESFESRGVPTAYVVTPVHKSPVSRFIQGIALGFLFAALTMLAVMVIGAVIDGDVHQLFEDYANKGGPLASIAGVLAGWGTRQFVVALFGIGFVTSILQS